MNPRTKRRKLSLRFTTRGVIVGFRGDNRCKVRKENGSIVFLPRKQLAIRNPAQTTPADAPVHGSTQVESGDQ